jgi:hypothetical protein
MKGITIIIIDPLVRREPVQPGDVLSAVPVKVADLEHYAHLRTKREPTHPTRPSKFSPGGMRPGGRRFK